MGNDTGSEIYCNSGNRLASRALTRLDESINLLDRMKAELVKMRKAVTVVDERLPLDRKLADANKINVGILKAAWLVAWIGNKNFEMYMQADAVVADWGRAGRKAEEVSMVRTVLGHRAVSGVNVPENFLSTLSAC